MSDLSGEVADFVDLWFGPQDYGVRDVIGTVRRLLTFNRPVSSTFDGDVEVLVVEEQGVWLWGRTADDRYVERENEPGLPWRETGETASEFWLHHAAFEAVTNLPASRSAQLFDAEIVASILCETAPLPCRSWTWPGTNQVIHYRDASVAMVCTDGDDFWVVVSAPQEADLLWADTLGLNWDEQDTRSGLGQ